MERVVLWAGLVALIAPYYPEGCAGRPSFALETMLLNATESIYRPSHHCRLGHAQGACALGVNQHDDKFRVKALTETIAKYGMPEIFNTDQGN